MLDQSDLKDSAGTTLKTGPLTEDDLISYNSPTNYMDLVTMNQGGFEKVVYSNVFTGNDGKIVIQYWCFYLNQPEFLGDHEGDWEMIQLVLPDKDSSPTDAYYSQHYDGDHRTWVNVLKETWADGTVHPKVYVDKDDHWSKFTGSETDKWTTKDGNYKVVTLSNEPWLMFRGIWGKDGASLSPNGPVFRHSKSGGEPEAYMWTDPIYWGDVAC